jgi:4-hydroxyproline epimerase
MENLQGLTDRSIAIRRALSTRGITGEGGAEIDHIELYEPSTGRNFVLCPGMAYDRSPCGTGTSAKLACLAADGLLAPGETWIQTSVTGSRLEASYQPGENGRILPTITGRAFVTAETQLILQEDDPLRHGIC